MFDLKLDWWELLVRAITVYVVLLVMVRLSGKRAVGQFSPFDLLVVLLLSQAVAGSLTGGDESLVGGLFVAAALLVVNAMVDLATTYSQKAEKIIEGHEVLLGRNGRAFYDVMKANRVTKSQFENALRQADITEEELELAILEADGTISILTKKPK